eukprot:6001751-Alexandrium_andersonii.AAC.1
MFSANEMRAPAGFLQKVSTLDARLQGVRLCIMAAQIASDKKADTKDSLPCCCVRCSIGGAPVRAQRLGSVLASPI